MSLEIYPFPKEAEASKNYRVKINGSEIFVCDAQVCLEVLDNPTMVYAPQMSSYASFGADPEDEIFVEVETLFCNTVGEAVVLPRSKQILAERKGNRITFRMHVGDQLCVYPDQAENQMLMLFANNRAELPEVDPEDENTLYFGPGVHMIDNEDNRIHMRSGQTLYLAGGAIVFGKVYAYDCENISIVGPGVLCGSKTNSRWAEWMRPVMGIRNDIRRTHMIYIEKCKNVTLHSACFVDSECWTVCMIGNTNVKIHNVKVIGYQINNDGIDICSCRNVHISNCFLRNSDDGLVIKVLEGRGETKDVLAEKCVLWSDRASSLEIGHEVVGADVTNVVFRDIDILNCTEETFGYHAIDITNVDSGKVSDILFENIRIENCVRFVGIRIRESIFRNAHSKGIGSVCDITFRHIVCNGKRGMFFFGKDEKHKIRNVVLEDITFGNTPLTSLAEARHNSWVEGIVLKSADGTVLDQLTPYPAESEIVPVDISGMANMTVGFDRGVYRMGCPDFMDMPENPVYDGVPFRLLAQGYYVNGEGTFKRCVLPPNRIRSARPAVAQCGFHTNWLFFLHTATNVYSEIDTIIARYIVTYTDGSREEIPVRNQNDCNDWQTWSLAGWNAGHKSIRFYIQPWKNPTPQKEIESIEMRDGDIHDMCMLFAVSRA